jgi:putative FmdB family regulatory protein
MPIYDYKCKGCGKQFEFLVLKSRAAACPACGSQRLEQLPSTGIAVSSAGIRQTNLERAQRKVKNSSETRERHVAEIEEIKEHAPHLFTKKKKKK